MDMLAFLNVIMRHLPNMSLDTALIIANDVAVLTAPQPTTEDDAKRSTEDARIARATLYAYCELDGDALQDRKIQSIKALRENFPGLGLRAAKSIVDETAERMRNEAAGYGYADDEDEWGPNPYLDSDYEDYDSE